MASVIRYGSARLYASVATSPTVLRSLTLVNGVEFGFNVNRSNVKSLGHDKILSKNITPPEPTVSFSYYLSDLDNERLFTLPVTSVESIMGGIPLFQNPQPIDLAFVTDEQSRDINRLDASKHDDLSVCLMTNAYLSSYSFSLDSSGFINARVSFTGDDMLFKTFKNLSEYSVLEEDSEDNLLTNQNSFIMNDGSEELTSNIGGANTQTKVSAFNFSANIPYRRLVDFGQIYHKKKVDHPFQTSISVRAFADSFHEGKISDVLCSDKKNDFIITNKRLNCDGDFDEKSGFLFKGAQLVSQNYSQGTSGFLETELNFSLWTSRNCGIYFTQHVTTNDLLAGENSSVIDNILLEDASGGKGRILLDTILDMLTSIKDFKNDVACSPSMLN
tara:strand:- start:12855 stop:14018 length:1164 start_codon:yes stop_codon:yes gene_type:complete